MLIFTLTVLLTTVISLCFFKKNFWSNRYLILLIIVGVSFIATLTTNYIVRNKLSTRSEIIWKKNIHLFYINDSSFYKKDSINIQYSDTGYVGKKPILVNVKKKILKIDSLVNKDSTFLFIKNWDYYSQDVNKFLLTKKDSIHQIPTHYIFYTTNNDTIIGFFEDIDDQDYYKFNDVYIDKSPDNTSYLLNKKLYYDTKTSNWLTGFSFPSISSIKILYIPAKEYNNIPKQFLRKIPF